jgi:hypothetical protein
MDGVKTAELREAVDMLTRRTMHYEDAKFVQADPLLVQLWMEIGNSSNHGQGGASGGPKIPLAAAAFDLMTAITEEVAENYWLTYRLHRGERKSLAAQLLAWARAAESDADLLANAHRAITGYVGQITNLLRPVRRMEITGICPACKVDQIVMTEDGETFRQKVLSIYYDFDGKLAGATCVACGNIWPADGLEQLARLIVSQEGTDNGQDADEANPSDSAGHGDSPGS